MNNDMMFEGIFFSLIHELPNYVKTFDVGEEGRRKSMRIDLVLTKRGESV